MDNNTLLLAAIAVVVNGAFLYLIIGAATKASARAKYEWAQMRILTEMALKAGVEQDTLQKIIDQAK